MQIDERAGLSAYRTGKLSERISERLAEQRVWSSKNMATTPHMEMWLDHRILFGLTFTYS
jgi:hypothetical protein